jgi:hypothetical protein
MANKVLMGARHHQCLTKIGEEGEEGPWIRYEEQKLK